MTRDPRSNDSVGKSGRRSILLVAYHFPPSSAIGGMRPATFAKHLPSLGWDPIVLTIGERYLEKADQGRLAGLERVPIIRTRIFPTLRDLYLRLKQTALRLRGRTPAVPAPSAPQQAGVQETMGQRLKRYVVSLVLTLPDTETGWILPASSRAVREIGKRKVKAIYTSCPPYSVHLVGLIVKKLTGVVWVADFRDPWATVGRKLFPTCRLSMAIEAKLEAMVMGHADLVLTTVEQLSSVYRERYLHLPTDRFLSIPNAVNITSCRKKALPRYERFTLSYTGSLYFGRTPEPVFAAVRKLIDSGRVQPDRIRILLVGQCRFLDDRPIEVVIASYGLAAIVEVEDTVPQAKAREIIERSHLALLLAPEQPYQIPAKLYEYLAIGTSVLAVVGPGATGDMVAATRCGSAFSPSDVAGMAEFILRMMLHAPSPAAPDEQVLAQFAPRQLTARLAAGLDRIAGNNRLLAAMGRGRRGRNGEAM